MSAKGTRITEKEVLRMVELYEKHRNFKKVGKMMRRDAGTVSKYVHQWLAVYGCMQQMRAVAPDPRYTPITDDYTPYFKK